MTDQERAAVSAMLATLRERTQHVTRTLPPTDPYRIGWQDCMRVAMDTLRKS